MGYSPKIFKDFLGIHQKSLKIYGVKILKIEFVIEKMITVHYKSLKIYGVFTKNRWRFLGDS